MLARLLRSLAVLCLAGLSASAATILFQGSIPDDTGVVLINFTLNSAQTVTIHSYGYAGGTVPTLPVATNISAGGFAPNAIIFDGSGNQIISDNGGHCGNTLADPVTGNCSDPFIQQLISAGFYTLALVEWDNVPATGNLADGFKQDGNPGFTCAEFGLLGNFCDTTTALGTQRNGNWAVAITGADSATLTPEPATFTLSMTCLLAIIARRRRH